MPEIPKSYRYITWLLVDGREICSGGLATITAIHAVLWNSPFLRQDYSEDTINKAKGIIDTRLKLNTVLWQGIHRIELLHADNMLSSIIARYEEGKVVASESGFYE